MASKRFKSGSSSKPQEHYGIAENDRISILPDSILCHILSFLPTKDSVKTSIFSRRWRFTWTSVAALDLDDLYYPRGKSRSKKPFKNFVKMVLIRHSHPCVQRFRLRHGNSYPTSVVNPWISYAITHNVEKLDLCMQGNVKLPPTLFNCTTIRVLKLADGIDLDVPESVSLPTLKVVHFQSLQSLCDDNINRILSGSPILETLEIGRSGSADGVNIFSIVSSSLKTLIITTQCEYCNPYGVVIDAPKLEYLELRDRRSQFMLDCSVEIKNAPSLVKLLLDFSCSVVNMTWNLYEMQNVKVLSAPSYMLQNLLSYHYANICFSNLTQLTVRYCRKDLSVLPQILTGLPNLEVLILDKMFNYYLITSEDWEQEKIEISCLKCSLKLKWLEFKQFEANEVQMQILEYFLENATDLNEIRLGTRSRYPRESAFLNKLFNNPRCSKSFKIIIS